jgi:hypothetical protein
MDEIIRIELEDAIDDVMNLAFAEGVFSVHEVIEIIFKFYGAVLIAVKFCVITPEQANTLHFWLVAMFEL